MNDESPDPARRSAEHPEGGNELPSTVPGGAAGEGASRADAPGDPTGGEEMANAPSKVVEVPDEVETDDPAQGHRPEG